MAKYSNDSNIKLIKDTNLYIPHGGDDSESSSTVTRLEFKQGDSIRFLKSETRKVLKALGANRQEQTRYIKEAFNNFKDINKEAAHA
tara:strand:+ start:164 stop:424 length:261 start_codon:yes stop_codon:yes gene_type:complete